MPVEEIEEVIAVVSRSSSKDRSSFASILEKLARQADKRVRKIMQDVVIASSQALPTLLSSTSSVAINASQMTTSFTMTATAITSTLVAASALTTVAVVAAVENVGVEVLEDFLEQAGIANIPGIGDLVSDLVGEVTEQQLLEAANSVSDDILALYADENVTTKNAIEAMTQSDNVILAKVAATIEQAGSIEAAFGDLNQLAEAVFSSTFFDTGNFGDNSRETFLRLLNNAEDRFSNRDEGFEPRLLEVSLASIDENSVQTVLVTWETYDQGLITQTYTIPAQDYEDSPTFALNASLPYEGGTVTQVANIAINNINEASEVVSVEGQRVNENEPITLTVNWFDPESGYSVRTYTFSSQNYEETGGTQSFEIRITNPDGTVSTEQVDVFIADVDEHPQIASWEIVSNAENADMVVQVTWMTDDASLITQTYTLPAANYEETPTVTFDPSVTIDGLTGRGTLTFGVEDINEQPVFDSVSKTYFNENEQIVFEVVWNDPEDGPVIQTYSMLAQDFEENPTLQVDVEYTDSEGVTTTQALTFDIVNVNEAPSISAVSHTSIAENELATVSVIWADPEQGEIVQNYDIPSQDFESGEDYSFIATFTDNEGNTFTREIELEVTNVNEAPALVSSREYVVEENSVTTIQVVWNDPEDGEVIQIYTLPAQNYELEANPTLAVSYTDSNGETVTEQLDIQVQDVNEAPVSITFDAVFNPLTLSYAITLNSFDPDTGDTLIFSQDGVDLEGNVVVYTSADLLNSPPDTLLSVRDSSGESLSVTVSPPQLVQTEGNDVPVFVSSSITNIDENSGTTSITLTWFDPEDGLLTSMVSVPSQDYESNSVVSVIGQVTDSEGETTQHELELQVNDVNEVATLTRTSVLDIPENETFTITLFWDDPEQGEVQTTYVIPAQDFELDDTYTFTPSFTDQGGLTAEGEVTVSVTNVDEPATFLGMSVDTIKENEPFEVTVMWLDPEEGVVSEIYTVPAQDFEENAEYSLTATFTDSGGNTVTQDLTINVEDVNEPPVFVGVSHSTIEENQTIQVTVLWNDPEQGLIQQTYTVPAQDFEASGTYTFSAIVTDNGGLSTTQEVTIAVTDVDEAPIYVGQSITSFDENTPTQITVNWFDPEDGPIDIVYDIPAQNFEANTTYPMDVSVVDSAGNITSKTIVLQVNDVNEPPVLVRVEGDLALFENVSTQVTTVWNDPEDGEFTSQQTIRPLDFEEYGGDVRITFTASDSDGLSGTGQQDFRLIDDTNENYLINSDFDAGLQGWTVNSGVDFREGSRASTVYSNDGKYIDLDKGGSPGSISQTVTNLEAGEEYLLTFEYMGSDGNNTDLYIKWNGQIIKIDGEDQAFDRRTDTPITVTIPLIAREGENVVELYAITNSGTSPAIDNIRLIDLPDWYNEERVIRDLSADNPLDLRLDTLEAVNSLETDGGEGVYLADSEGGAHLLAVDNNTSERGFNNSLTTFVRLENPASSFSFTIVMEMTEKNRDKDSLEVFLIRLDANGEYDADSPLIVDTYTFNDVKSGIQTLEGSFDTHMPSGDYALVMDLDEPGTDNTDWMLYSVGAEVDEYPMPLDLSSFTSNDAGLSQVIDLEEGQEYVLTLNYVPSDAFQVLHNGEIVLDIQRDLASDTEARTSTISLIGGENQDTLTLTGEGILDGEISSFHGIYIEPADHGSGF